MKQKKVCMSIKKRNIILLESIENSFESIFIDMPCSYCLPCLKTFLYYFIIMPFLVLLHYLRGKKIKDTTKQ